MKTRELKTTDFPDIPKIDATKLWRDIVETDSFYDNHKYSFGKRCPTELKKAFDYINKNRQKVKEQYLSKKYTGRWLIDLLPGEEFYGVYHTDRKNQNCTLVEYFYDAYDNWINSVQEIKSKYNKEINAIEHLERLGYKIEKA